jgi:hypothetical protein
VTQASGCSYSVEPSSLDVAGDGGNAVASVTTGPGCSWTASSAVDWITVTSPTGGDSPQLTLAVKPNASARRTGTVTVAGHTLTINQASLCRWFFAPPSHEFDASGGNGNVLVFVTGACSWTAVPNVSWIQITAGGTNTGGGLLQFVVPPNRGGPRTGTIAIGGENYVVTQGGGGDHWRAERRLGLLTIVHADPSGIPIRRISRGERSERREDDALRRAGFAGHAKDDETDRYKQLRATCCLYLSASPSFRRARAAAKRIARWISILPFEWELFSLRSRRSPRENVVPATPTRQHSIRHG